MTTSTPAAPLPGWAVAGQAWAHAALDWAYGFETYAADAVEAVFGTLGVGPGTEMLDIACGSGFAAGRAERLGARVAGLDAAAGLIDIARRRAPGADLRVGDMFDLPWVDGEFDIVTSFNGIWGGCTAALEEARRVLRRNGRIGLTFWGPGDRLDLRDFFIAVGTSTPSVGQEMTGLAEIGAPGVVESMLSEAGFDRIERFASPSVLEFPDTDALVRAMRSPGLVVPKLEAIGEENYRDLVVDALARVASPDGSYRILNELTCVTAHAAV